MFNKKQLSLFVLLLSVLTGSAQSNDCNFMIGGRVTDADTELPLSGVSITVMPGNIVIKTDGHGFYRSQSLCKGIYTLTFKSLGFENNVQQLGLTKNETLNVSMQHGDIVLHDVEVVGHKPVHRSTARTTTLNSEQLEESRGAVLGDALSKIAGVSTLKTGNSIVKPVINGMHSNRVLILNNGIRQEGQQWGSEHAPEIDPFIAKELTVIKGAEGVRYGADALGGVVMVSPAPLQIDGPLSGEVNMVGASNGRIGTAAATLNGSIKGVKGFGWRAQGSIKKGGNIKSADYYLGNTGINELNFSGAIAYNTTSTKYELYYSHFNTEIGILESSHIGTVEDIQARIAYGRPFEKYEFTYRIKPPRQQVTHDLAKLKAHKDLNNGASIDVQYAFQRNHRQEFDLRRNAADDKKPMMDLVLTTQSLDVTYDHLHENGLRSLVGINGMAQVNNNTPGTGTTPLIPNYDSYNMGVFAVERFVKRSYELEAGLRYDFKYFDAAGYRYDYSQFNENGGLDLNYFTGIRRFHNISGSVGAVWHLNSQLDLRSNLGLAWRAPSANELYSDGLHHGSAIYEVGNPDMKSEQGYKWVNSLSYNNQKLSINLDIYGQYVSNYIYAQPNPDSVRRTIRGTFPIFVYEQTNASFWGIDFSGSYALTNQLTYSANIAIVRAKDERNGTYLPYIPADRVDHNLRWSFTNSNGHWTRPFLQVGHRFVARQTRYNKDSDYTSPPPSYHLFDAVAGIKYQMAKQTVGLNISVDNLTNNLYKEYMNRFRYYAHEMGRNITVRLFYNF
ncbi:MAG TPA: TonB-dependent receptor [Pseudosphingobacterium sp.]|nr:TonB-dependent receptor [Pseudosphingobacterium sp.]